MNFGSSRWRTTDAAFQPETPYSAFFGVWIVDATRRIALRLAGIVRGPHGPAAPAQVFGYHIRTTDDPLDENHVG